MKRWSENREPRPRVWPPIIDHVGAYALAFDLTPEEGFDEVTRLDAKRFRISGEITPDFKDMWEGVKWRLQRIPIRDLKIDYSMVFDEDRAEAYAKKAGPLPPILVGLNGQVLDGQHRTAAAQKRGDTLVLAYVPIVLEGASGPSCCMVGNSIDSRTFCGAWAEDKVVSEIPSEVTCKGCKAAAIEWQMERRNYLGDYLLGRKIPPWRESRESKRRWIDG